MSLQYTFMIDNDDDGGGDGNDRKKPYGYLIHNKKG